MPDTVAELQEKIKALNAENKELKAEIKSIKKEHSAEIKSLKKEHSAEIKAKDKEIKTLNSQIKKKKPKDPNAPKRSKNGFMFFTDEKRDVVKAENKDAKPTEISKIIGEMWSALKIYKEDGKHEETKKDPITGETITKRFDYSKKAQKYLDKASKDKKRYQKELKKYQKSLEKKSKKSSNKAKAS